MRFELVTFFVEDSFDEILKGAFLISEKGIVPDRIVKRGDLYQQTVFDDNYYIDELVTDEECKKILDTAKEVLNDAYISFQRGDKNILKEIMLYIAHYLKNPLDINNITIDYILEVKASVKKVTSETHRMKGFIRFQELSDGTLYAEIAPKHNVLPLIYKHFVNRLPSQIWVIHDTLRDSGVFYDGQNALLGKLELKSVYEKSSEEMKYQKIWKSFFEKITVEGRENKNLQKSKVPIFYRKNMTEF